MKFKYWSKMKWNSWFLCVRGRNIKTNLSFKSFEFVWRNMFSRDNWQNVSWNWRRLAITIPNVPIGIWPYAYRPTSLFARLIALCAIFFAGQAAQAQAYLESRLTTVKSRARPESDAVGIRSGGFMILPTISVSESYNDNILASESNTRDDLITDVEPAIIVKSDWNRHALKL